MVTRYLMIASIMLALTGCNKTLTIKDAESIGFVKKNQKLYQLIGAQDGWSGTISGEFVELYQYASSSIEPDPFANATEEGNFAGWVDKCRVGNLLMLSKGRSACDALRKLG